MAEMTDQFSLLGLEDELTCSICLSPFDCPVTIPCGHNFCQDCLLATWKDSYSCPQCRTHFPTKPELRKNTVLSTVVETIHLRTMKKEPDSLTRADSLTAEEKPAGKDDDVIRCDTCMEAEASQTCLTCMASFCEEHLRPHRENPTFRLHQLSEPITDLSERICPDHHKLMEFFCSQHDRPICSFCLQQVHKGCSFVSPEEQRSMKESDLRGKLDLLDGKITKNENVISQINALENKLKDSATNRKKALAVEYQQMRDMLTQEERNALNAVDHELEGGQTKLKCLIKKFTENVDSMNTAKEVIHALLSQTQSLAFLQASFTLPPAVTFDPYTPRISLDSKKVISAQSFCGAFKLYLQDVLKQPVDARLQILKPGETAAPVSAPLSFGSPQLESEATKTQKQNKPPRSHSPGRSHITPLLQPVNPPVHAEAFGGYHPPPNYYRPAFLPGQKPRAYRGPVILEFGPGIQPKTGPKKKNQKQTPSKATEANKGNKNRAQSVENLLDSGGKEKAGGCSPASESKETPVKTPEIPPNIPSAESRSELLKYVRILTLDPKTTHKRIVLSEDFTKATVSDEHVNYPDCPERFAVCSQVLASQCFTRGRHYWEVQLSSNNFIGVGLAYSSIDRKGPTSRLGRNAQSWCIEWFNVKLSAWYNSSETVLANSGGKRIGVLLDWEQGTATFYKVADRAYPFHCFVFPFAEAVYPAFWMFSSGSSISCKVQA